MSEYFYEDTGQVKPARKSLTEQVKDLEQSLIERAIKQYGGNKNQAAIHLGMNRTTLSEKMKNYGMKTRVTQKVEVAYDPK